MLKVFVYGTLKPGEHYYSIYCAGKTVSEKQAIALGKLYNYPTLGYPAMIPGTHRVCGYLLSFTNPKILEKLDDLEGFDPRQPPEKNEYDRQEIEVFNPQNIEQSLGCAWAYFQTLDRVRAWGGIWLPDGCWSGNHKSS